MSFFEKRDPVLLESRLTAFEDGAIEATPGAALEYVEMVYSGERVRSRVRQVQRRIEEGRPWPVSLPDWASLFAHLERFGFQVRCPTRDSAPLEAEAFWTRYEEAYRTLAHRILPAAIERDFRWRVVRSSSERDPGAVVCSEPVRSVLVDQLGRGSLVGGLRLGWKMAEEGVDGGIRRLRHLVVESGLRLDFTHTKQRCQRLLLHRDLGAQVAARIAGMLNASRLVERRLEPLDVVAFEADYVDAFLDILFRESIPGMLA